MIQIYETDPRPKGTAMLRGFLHRCPNCAKGSIFRKYLKVADYCSSCEEELFHQQTDDAPPYFTILIVGHIILPMALGAEKFWHWDTTTHFMIWLPAIVILSLILLPCIKGAIVGLQWALRMHGFSGEIDVPVSGDSEIRGT